MCCGGGPISSPSGHRAEGCDFSDRTSSTKLWAMGADIRTGTFRPSTILNTTWVVRTFCRSADDRPSDEGDKGERRLSRSGDCRRELGLLPAPLSVGEVLRRRLPAVVGRHGWEWAGARLCERAQPQKPGDRGQTFGGPDGWDEQKQGGLEVFAGGVPRSSPKDGAVTTTLPKMQPCKPGIPTTHACLRYALKQCGLG